VAAQLRRIPVVTFTHEGISGRGDLPDQDSGSSMKEYQEARTGRGIAKVTTVVCCRYELPVIWQLAAVRRASFSPSDGKSTAIVTFALLKIFKNFYRKRLH